MQPTAKWLQGEENLELEQRLRYVRKEVDAKAL
jgi:hypothetical protein